MANILVASLGELPIVVTAIYKLLREQEGIEIDTVVALRPEGEDVKCGYDLIEEALHGKCELRYLQLPFLDANGEDESYQFLQMLSGQLSTFQQNGDAVYFSLAGGRKNMSALMALVVPFFPCIKRLYQVLDIDEVNSDESGHQFKSVTELIELSDAKRKAALDPPLAKLLLVNIPYQEQEHVSEQLLAQIYTLDNEQLNKLWEEDPTQAEATEFGRLLTRPDITGHILEVWVTEYVRDYFSDLLKTDVLRARRFKACFNQMRYAEQLSNPLSQHGQIRDGSHVFHYYKRLDTDERVFYHTEPEDIRRYPRADVSRVIISGLVLHYKNKYKPDEATLLKLPLTPIYPVQSLFPSEVILIVPLGTAPMVATQLYALLQYEGHTIREVSIIYPGLSQKVRNSAALVKEAFAFERPSLPVRDVSIADMKDILSEGDCQHYQQVLEAAIGDARDRHPECEIVLALSGGRKSMAALAMFAAQREGIRYVYHTLIKDPTFSQDIEDETSVRALQPAKISEQKRNGRLFLRSYHDRLDQFVLFKVPVVPSAILPIH